MKKAITAIVVAIAIAIIAIVSKPTSNPANKKLASKSISYPVAPTGTLAVTVLLNGKITDAKVRVGNGLDYDKTMPNGGKVLIVENLQPGRYSFKISKAGYQIEVPMPAKGFLLQGREYKQVTINMVPIKRK